MNTHWAPHLEMSPKHFTMATIALVLPTTVWLNATEWMTSFTRHILNIHQSGYGAVCLLHGWCHLKLLSSESPLWWCLYGVGFLTNQQSHVNMRHVEWGENVWQVCRYSVLICGHTKMAFLSLYLLFYAHRCRLVMMNVHMNAFKPMPAVLLIGCACVQSHLYVIWLPWLTGSNFKNK